MESLSARLGADGTAVTGLNDADTDDLVARVRAHDPESVAVNLLFAYLDPNHEERLGRALENARTTGITRTPANPAARRRHAGHPADGAEDSGPRGMGRG